MCCVLKDLIEMNDCHVSGCGIFFDFGGGFWNEEELQIEIEGFLHVKWEEIR